MYVILFAFLFALNLVDVAFTKHLLDRDLTDEANPMADALILTYGWEGLLAWKLAFCVLGMFYGRDLERMVWPIKALFWMAVINYITLTVYHIFLVRMAP